MVAQRRAARRKMMLRARKHGPRRAGLSVAESVARNRSLAAAAQRRSANSKK